jgi:anti-sigma factor RsiW
MNCADIEILLCDYVDGTLHGTQKSAVEEHLAGCADCREFVQDASGAVEFMSRAANVEPPPELLTRLLFELPAVKQQLKPSWTQRVFGRWFEPVMQPRVAMSMAMTVLSFAMLSKCAGIQVRQLRPSDLNPVAVVGSVEDRAVRTWSRGVKYYESLRFVYEIQTQIKDWRDKSAAAQETQQQQQQKPNSQQPAQQSPKQQQSTPQEVKP